MNIAHSMTVHLFSVSIFFVWPLVVGLALVRALALVLAEVLLAEVLQAKVQLAEHQKICQIVIPTSHVKDHVKSVPVTLEL